MWFSVVWPSKTHRVVPLRELLQLFSSPESLSITCLVALKCFQNQSLTSRSQTLRNLPLHPPSSFVFCICLKVWGSSSPQQVVNRNRAGWNVKGCWRGECEGSWVAKQTLWQPTCQQVLSIIGKRRPRDSSGAPSLLSVFCSVVCLMGIWSCQAVVGSLFLPCLVQRKTEAKQERRKSGGKKGKRRKEHILNMNHCPGKFTKGD